MQQIAICVVHGGFSLSRKAAERLLELGSDEVELISRDDYVGENGDELLKNTQALGFGPWNVDDKTLLSGMGRDAKRDDPLLIQVVGELGGKEAGGRCAELKIIEIPDGVEWEIEEYDGLEWVAEKHRTWD